MATHLILRARRDFVAPSHTDVRVKAGECLDFTDPNVQKFFRSTLNWDAFAVDFINDEAPIDLTKARADADAARQLVKEADAKQADAAKLYADAQQALADHDAMIAKLNKATAEAEIDRKPDDIADENAKRAELKRNELAAAVAVRECSAAAAKAADEAGRLIVLTYSFGKNPTQGFAEQHIGKLDPIEILANATVEELLPLKGIGESKAAQLIEAAQALVAERNAIISAMTTAT